MNVGNSHYDVYDRESDYYRDLENAIPADKSTTDGFDKEEGRVK